ncbi:hypothetical protein Bbelb_317800 [Branchiostoma belcheri]|nr:hypothetical protein Bbelb_317800 [Branchiostoma belcheri]
MKATPAYGDGTKTTNSNDTWHATKAFSRKFKKLASEPKKNHGVTWHGQLQDKGNHPEDEDAAAEREEYREEWAMFEEDMAYLAHLDRIMDAEDSSEDEVEEAWRLYDQHIQADPETRRCPYPPHPHFGTPDPMTWSKPFVIPIVFRKKWNGTKKREVVGRRADKHLLSLTGRNILQHLSCVEDSEAARKKVIQRLPRNGQRRRHRHRRKQEDIFHPTCTFNSTTLTVKTRIVSCLPSVQSWYVRKFLRRHTTGEDTNDKHHLSAPRLPMVGCSPSVTSPESGFEDDQTTKPNTEGTSGCILQQDAGESSKINQRGDQKKIRSTDESIILREESLNQLGQEIET